MQDNGNIPTSRRDLLKLGALGLGVAGAVTIIGGQARAHTKASQASVKYQAEPKDGHSCADCKNFEAPASCKTVDGTVSEKGWCMVWVKK